MKSLKLVVDMTDIVVVPPAVSELGLFTIVKYLVFDDIT